LPLEETPLGIFFGLKCLDNSAAPKMRVFFTLLLIQCAQTGVNTKVKTINPSLMRAHIVQQGRFKQDHRATCSLQQSSEIGGTPIFCHSSTPWVGDYFYFKLPKSLLHRFSATLMHPLGRRLFLF